VPGLVRWRPRRPDNKEERGRQKERSSWILTDTIYARGRRGKPKKNYKACPPHRHSFIISSLIQHEQTTLEQPPQHTKIHYIYTHHPLHTSQNALLQRHRLLRGLCGLHHPRYEPASLAHGGASLVNKIPLGQQSSPLRLPSPTLARPRSLSGVVSLPTLPRPAKVPSRPSATRSVRVPRRSFLLLCFFSPFFL